MLQNVTAAAVQELVKENKSLPRTIVNTPDSNVKSVTQTTYYGKGREILSINL